MGPYKFPILFILTFGMIQKFYSTSEEIDNITRWKTEGFACPPGSSAQYAVVCSEYINRIEANSENAESGLLVMGILLSIIMVAIIISLGLYVRHLRKKLGPANSSSEHSGVELDQPLNTQANNMPSNDVMMDEEPGGGANNP